MNQIRRSPVTAARDRAELAALAGHTYGIVLACVLAAFALCVLLGAVMF
jgi:hypothetical protein